MILLAPPPSRWVLAGQINSMPPYSCSWSNLHFYINLPPPSTVHYRQRAWCGVPVCIFCKSEVTAAHPVQPYKLGTHILYTYIHIYKHSYIHSYIHSYVIHIHTCIYIHICIHRMILSQINPILSPNIKPNIQLNIEPNIQLNIVSWKMLLLSIYISVYCPLIIIVKTPTQPQLNST